MDSLLSFPVGLFHPLQHAGLSRRPLDPAQHGRQRTIPFVSYKRVTFPLPDDTTAIGKHPIDD